MIGDEVMVSIEFASGRVFAKSPEASTDRTLATLLFTDIVGSTTTVERLGDRAWRDLLLAHTARLVDHRGPCCPAPAFVPRAAACTS